MDTSPSGWQQSESLAWVGHDTPPPPRVSKAARIALAAGLGATIAGMLSTDTLCPEHRAWVLAIGLVSIAAAITAVVALVRASWVAMPLALGSAVGGIGIGIIDIAHDPQRGTIVAMAFAALAVVAGALVAADLRRLDWDDRLRRSIRPQADQASTSAPAATASGEHDDAADRPTLVD